MQSRRVTDADALYKLLIAQGELRSIAERITPAVAPRVARKLRALLKSVDGALRNAEAHALRRRIQADGTVR